MPSKASLNLRPARVLAIPAPPRTLSYGPSRAADDLRATFAAAFHSAAEEDPVRSTVSVGCTQLGEDLPLLAALSVASVWLCQAKRGARNQVAGL